ncbi:MAG: hypothetical protein H6636_01315 [Anaerolineales bacterium]|nr:hypothetical protein [Anaerolineales bacterium]
MKTLPAIRSRSLWFVLTFSVSLFLVLSACKSNSETPTPGLNQTQAYETVVARITEVSAELETQAAPTTAATDSGLPSPTPPPAATDTGAPPTAVASTFTPLPTTSASACDRADAGLPIDVTIPDDTQFASGASFVKTWRLINAGSCTWTTGYALVFFSGEKMNGPDVVPLNADVAPGQVVDLSVNLTAPASSGTYQGNWMLRNPSGVLFGIGPEGNSFFWVRIVVPGGEGTATITPTPDGSATITPTPNGTATVTPTPTSGATPVVIVNSSIAFQPDGYIDLDTGVTNGGSGNDVSYTADQSGTHPLSTLGSAGFSVYGSQAPTFDNCRAANISSGSLTVENLAAGTYLCFRTEQGNYGWLRIDGFDASSALLSLSLLTWH